MTKRFDFLGAFILAAVVFISYQPSFRLGFYLDDYYNIERAGRIEWADAARQIFDPRAQTLWYRPLQGLQFFIEYHLFGANANAYHLVNIAYHAINVLLLYAIVRRVSKRWLVGFLAAFFYATFTVYISGVNWSAIVEPLLGIFYLLSFWFWWAYLEKKNRSDYLFALGAMILALMSKQTALTIPVVCFLADRLLMREKISLIDLARRYVPFAIVVIFFAALQYIAPSTSTFTGWFGWQVGPAMAAILWEYCVLLLVPWGVFPSIDVNPVSVGELWSYAWTIVALAVLAFVTWRQRNRWFIFLGIFSFITLVPVLPFPFLEHRYVYLPIISIAIILGLLFARAKNLFAIVAPILLALLAIGNGVLLDDSAATAADWTRALRVPFRDIERQNPTFPADTLLYFIDPITPTEGGLSGMFFLRYGKDVTVRNWSQYAGLREHNAAYVYYFDETRRPQKIDVEPNVTTRITPALPLDFSAPIRLEGYELPRTTIRRGTPLVLILYFRARERIAQEYSVFVHLLDHNGKIVAQSDSQPRKGQAPTSQWRPGLLSVDTILLPIGADVPAGTGYKIEFGLFDEQTGNRLAVSATDRVIIETFGVIE